MVGMATIASSPTGGPSARWRARRTDRASTSCTSELFPDPLTPVTQVNAARGMRASTCLRLWTAAPRISIHPGLRQPAAGVVGLGRRGGSVEVLGRDGAGRGGEPVRRRSGHDRAAVRAGPGPEVDDPVGRADHRLVVLDDQDAVAHLLEPSQAGDQPGGVARMQAGCRLVQDVADPHQPRAELGRQPRPLELAAGERVRAPVQRQVLQPDGDQVPEPARDLGEQGRLVTASAAGSG